jgi:hypothetical protein
MDENALRSAWLKALRGHLRELRTRGEALIELKGSQRKAISWEVGQPLNGRMDYAYTRILFH